MEYFIFKVEPKFPISEYNSITSFICSSKSEEEAKLLDPRISYYSWSIIKNECNINEERYNLKLYPELLLATKIRKSFIQRSEILKRHILYG